MSENTTPNNHEKSKTVSNGQPQVQKLSHKEMEHIVKLSLVRECNIYGKSYKETQQFFKDRSLSLSSSQWKNLRIELKSSKSAKNWFSKEALFVIEEDHMISVERIRKVEDKIVSIMLGLLNDDDFETSINYDTDKSGIVKLRVRNYNTELLIKLTAQFQSLQETKTKMFAATPLVQELMEVHRRQEVEQNTPPPVKTEKEITND